MRLRISHRELHQFRIDFMKGKKSLNAQLSTMNKETVALNRATMFRTYNGQRLGQAFCNQFMNESLGMSDPELFNEVDEQKAMEIILEKYME